LPYRAAAAGSGRRLHCGNIYGAQRPGEGDTAGHFLLESSPTRFAGALFAEMNMRALILASAAALAGSIATLALAQPAEPTAPAPSARTGAPSCFFANQFDNWRAQDASTIFVRINTNRFYKLEMSGTCPALLWPNAHLIMDIRGSNTICTPLDWQLKVSSGIHDIPMPCIVKTMTPLTPEQAAAIPPKFKP
jgi:hypothetical protein